MTAAAKKSVSSRYILAKLMLAGEEFFSELASASRAPNSQSLSQAINLATQKFKDVYNQKLTQTICMIGPAMAPELNRRSKIDKDAVERLVLRTIPRPSPGTVAVGDVVALTNPLHPNDTNNVLVRRVAAVEGAQMVSDSSSDQPFILPSGHCWVLADNTELGPHEVIDSRTFGALDMSKILGRVIYYASSATEHGDVVNSPQSREADAPIIEQEVEVEKLLDLQQES